MCSRISYWKHYSFWFNGNRFCTDSFICQHFCQSVDSCQRPYSGSLRSDGFLTVSCFLWKRQFFDSFNDWNHHCTCPSQKNEERGGMSMSNLYIFFSILIIALITGGLRFLPFLVFNNRVKVPVFIEYLGKVLPFSVMGMLVVYCLKDIKFDKKHRIC